MQGPIFKTGDLISLSPKRRPWELLERKIAKGFTVEAASVQCGIPINEVFDYIKLKSTEIFALDFQLRLEGQSAIKTALAKLKELAAGDCREGKDFESTDLEAAKALAKFGIDALRLAQSGVKGGKGGGGAEPDDDLFDRSPDPWKLKEIT